MLMHQCQGKRGSSERIGEAADELKVWIPVLLSP